MADDPLAAALVRLDRAVARVEAAADASVVPETDDLARSYAQLDARHGRLRTHVQETIERLDAMIAEGAAH